MHKTCGDPGQMESSTEKETGHRVQPLTRKLFVIDNCWKPENQFFLSGCIKSTLGQTVGLGELGQHKLNSLFSVHGFFCFTFFKILILIVLKFLLSIFQFVLIFVSCVLFWLFLREQEIGYEFGWEYVGRIGEGKRM